MKLEILLTIFVVISLIIDYWISYTVNKKEKMFDYGIFSKDHLYSPKIKLYQTIIAIIAIAIAFIFIFVFVSIFNVDIH